MVGGEAFEAGCIKDISLEIKLTGKLCVCFVTITF